MQLKQYPTKIDLKELKTLLTSYYNIGVSIREIHFLTCQKDANGHKRYMSFFNNGLKLAKKYLGGKDAYFSRKFQYEC